MKTIKKRNYLNFSVILLLLLIMGCKSDKKQNEQIPLEKDKTNVIEVITRSMDFQT